MEGCKINQQVSITVEEEKLKGQRQESSPEYQVWGMSWGYKQEYKSKGHEMEEENSFGRENNNSNFVWPWLHSTKGS